MSLVLADRVRETTETTGTGTITLVGAVQGFQSFAVIGNNNTTYYTINRNTEWEVGIGTYYGGTLSRDTVYASSNGGAKVNFSAGSKDVFVTYPASKSVNEDANNRVLIPYTSGTTNVGSLNVGDATAHTDSGVIAGFTASEPLYLYTSLQNTSSANTSYASYAVNDGGHTAYGELGINNANYSYSAAGFPNNGFSAPLASFVESFGGPLVLGSWDNQKISFIVNGSVNTTDAMTINTNGSVAFNGQVGTSGQVLQSNATSAPTWVTPSSGTVTSVTATSPVASTGGTTPVISMPAATTSVSGYLTSTDWTTFNGKGSGTVTSVAATAGTGISITGSPITTTGTLNITNTAPDQTVVLTASTGISTSGTYPNFTITNSAPDQTVALTAGTGISTSGTYPNFTITNSAPDQTVALTGAGTTSITGTYPNFTITSNDSATGTVTSVAALTLGTSGTDLGSTVANGSTTPVITLNVPTASATNRGALSAADWTTFNGKGSGTVTSVTGTSPVASSGGATPAISLASGYGDTLNPYASKTAKYVLAAPNGADGLPTFRAIVASDIPTLNQNTTGSAATLTTARTIAITGDLAYTSASFDGSGNVTAAGTLATVNTNVGSFTYASLTVNGKGLITAASNGTAPVTSVTGTSPVVSSGGTTPAISMAAATASVNGYLTSTDWTTFNSKGSGTVTSVTGTAPVVSSGGATPAISMAAATASVNGYLTSTDWTTFNGKGSGTVTSVAALTLGTTGTDLSSTVANGTTTPVITLNVPTASASNRGVLSSADWTTFNGKGAGTVTSVAATVPSFLSVSGSPITTSGTLAITLSGTALPIANGGTGATTLAGASIATYSGTETLTNKRIDPRVTSAASASTLTPDISASDVYAYTALAAGLTINAPTGTPLDGDKLMFRLLDNGTGRALTWNATYTVIGVTLPTTTTANKTTYVGCIYNANNTRWDVIAVTTQA